MKKILDVVDEINLQNGMKFKNRSKIKCRKYNLRKDQGLMSDSYIKKASQQFREITTGNFLKKEKT